MLVSCVLAFVCISPKRPREDTGGAERSEVEIATSRLNLIKSRPVGDMEALIRPGIHMYKCEVNYCRYSELPEYLFSWKKTTLWSNKNLIMNNFEPRICTARGQRCCVGQIDPRTGSYAHFNRMAFTSYGYDRMNRQLWATMPPLLCRDVRDAVINALLTDF